MGGRLFEGGRLLQILNLRRGANSKRGAYLKLGANSSIYGIAYGNIFLELFLGNLDEEMTSAGYKRERNKIK